MTDGGRQKPPPDDRTLLDPLNADELRALREARAKMQAAKGGAVAHQVVIGPDGGEDIGDAPTRAMPSLPQFENHGATLEKISTGSHKAAPAPHREAPQAQAPHGQDDATLRPTPRDKVPQAPAQPQARPPVGAPGQPPAGVAGPTGFGENTLMWMAPPKAAVNAGNATIAGDMPKVQASPARALKAVGGVAVLVALIALLSWAVLGKKERAVIDLHTNPPKAAVKINGNPTKNLTPMKLNLLEGKWDIEITLDGYKPYAFSVTVEKGSQPSRKDIDLEPISKAGLVTIGVNVQPVAANITLDGETYPARRSVKVPNIDPKKPHKIMIEAGGYLKVEQEIQADQLKDTYNYLLQEDANDKPK